MGYYLSLGAKPAIKTTLVAKYDWDIDSSPNYDIIIEIMPAKLLAWGKYGQRRWPGAEVLRVWDF